MSKESSYKTTDTIFPTFIARMPPQYTSIILAAASILLGTVRSQNGGTLPTGDSYVCVPPGFCNNNSPPPGIDPRIVTPNQPTVPGSCPAGTIPCIVQGPNSQCGNRFVPQTNTGNGPADVGAHPWVAYLAVGNAYIGAGVLLDNYHVLTAAHKVYNITPPQSITVYMGVYNPANPLNSQNRQVASVRLNEGFNANTVPLSLKNDIAILTVVSPFSLSQSNINTACLPAPNAVFTGQRCVVAAWGQTSFAVNDAPTNPMRQVYVTVVDYNTCRNSMSTLLSTQVDYYLDTNGREICAGGEPMADACTRDGGAPLICPGTGRGSIAGLVIWGKNCGQPGVYGVYVGVAAYRTWIDSVINGFNAGK